MVDDKMCINVRNERLMVRIDPVLTDTLLAREGTALVTMNGRPFRGFLYVDGAALRTDKALHEWITLALDFNGRAKRSAKAKKKPTSPF